MRRKLKSVKSEKSEKEAVAVLQALAQDTKYRATFLRIWNDFALNLERLVELRHTARDITWTHENWIALLFPFNYETILFFSPMIDHLSADEEDAFRAIYDRLSSLWRKFDEEEGARDPVLKDSLREFVGLAHWMTDYQFGMFLGETAPELTPEWDAACAQFVTVKGKLTEMMKS